MQEDYLQMFINYFAVNCVLDNKQLEPAAEEVHSLCALDCVVCSYVRLSPTLEQCKFHDSLFLSSSSCNQHQ